MSEETETAEGKGPGISLNDIALAVQVVDLASGRGALRGDELTTVGNLRDRFMAFLNYAKEQGQIDRVPGEQESESASEE